MMHQLSGIEFFIQANPLLSYLAVFFGMLVEGEGVILFASIFAWQGLISWFWLFVVVVVGTIVGDVLWYFAGKKLKGTCFGEWLDKRYERYGGHEFFEKIMARYHWYAILNKFMYFTTKPTVFLVGWHDYDFKKFLKITTYSTLIWSLLLLLIGSGFGYTIHLIGFKKIVHRIEIFALVLFVGIFVVEWLIKKIVCRKSKRR